VGRIFRADIAGRLTWLGVVSAAMAGEESSELNPSNVQGICPAGWHLPSKAEWEQLRTHLIANGYNYDDSTIGNKIAKSLASESGWDTSTVGGLRAMAICSFKKK